MFHVAVRTLCPLCIRNKRFSPTETIEVDAKWEGMNGALYFSFCFPHTLCSFQLYSVTRWNWMDHITWHVNRFMYRVKILLLHYYTHQRASTTEEAVNNSVNKMTWTVDVRQPLSSVAASVGKPLLHGVAAAVTGVRRRHGPNGRGSLAKAVPATATA